MVSIKDDAITVVSGLHYKLVAILAQLHIHSCGVKGYNDANEEYPDITGTVYSLH